MISCKKINQSNNEIRPLERENIEIIDIKGLKGDALLANLDFLKSVDKAYSIKNRIDGSSNKENILNKIKFDYKPLYNLKSKVLVDSLENGVKLYIQTINSRDIPDQLKSRQTTLYVEKNNVVIDSKVIYYNISFREGVILEKYYYLEKDKVYLMYINTENGNTLANKWEEYKIDNAGKIYLVDEVLLGYDSFRSFKKEYTTNLSDSKWNGTYRAYFKLDKEEGDVRNTETLRLKIASDSITLFFGGYSGEYNYLLQAEAASNKEVKLKYHSSLEVEAEDGVMFPTKGIEKNFGELTYDGKDYYWRCPFVSERYQEEIKKFKLEKIK